MPSYSFGSGSSRLGGRPTAGLFVTPAPLCLSIAPQCASNPRQSRYRDHTRCHNRPQTRWWHDAEGRRHYVECELPAAAALQQSGPTLRDLFAPSGGEATADDDAETPTEAPEGVLEAEDEDDDLADAIEIPAANENDET